MTLPNYDFFEGRGIQYAATAIEAQPCTGEEVAVVGGGSSAAQTAVFLSRTVSHVHLLVRGPSLSSTMSHSLVERIESSPRITLHTHSEIIDLAGDEALAEITWMDHGSGRSTTRSIRHVFVMIGAEPNTNWLKGFVDVDANGFILTSFDENSQPRRYPYATSVRGIFAAGDVRSGSLKRVASSIGEGGLRNSICSSILESRTLQFNELAHIDKNTPDPVGSKIWRDPQTGEPTGRLSEMFGPMLALIPKPSYEVREQSAKEVLEGFACNGVTTIYDFPSPDGLRMYQDLLAKGNYR